MKYTFLMHEEERLLFCKYAEKAKIYLEFGSGGSTIWTLLNVAARVYSIESERDWLVEMRKHAVIRDAESAGQLRLYHIDIGKTRGWGYPNGDKNKELFPLYSSDIFNDEKACYADTVLIDGRFRVACALKCILNLRDRNAVIMVHDFWDREYYHIILKYVNVIDRAGTLGVFGIKDGVDAALVEKDYELYKYDPR